MDDELLDALYTIPPEEQEYDGWLKIGMALHAAGYDVKDWDDWSKQDKARYTGYDCDYKWSTFDDSMGEDGVSEKYIFSKAINEYGWQPEHDTVKATGTGFGMVLSLDSATVENSSTTTPTATQELPEAPQMDKLSQISAQMREMFEPDELVNVAIRVQEDDPKAWDQGFCVKSSEVAGIIGAIDTAEYGACLCVNPLKAGGNRKTGNIAAYRMGLFESDVDDPDEFRRVTRELGLPVVCEIWSGHRSVHTIVKIDATTPKEFKDRWKLIAEAYESHGITMDKACSAVNKMVRLAGVERGEDVQTFLSGAFGAPTFAAWANKNEKPQLPPFGELHIKDEIIDDPELVEGVIRYGEIGLITARAKIGKSWSMIHMSIAVALGRTWLGHQCKKGKVLYIDPELKQKTLRKRIRKVALAFGLDDAEIDEVERAIVPWSLRGAMTADGGVPDIVNIVHDLELYKTPFDLVVLDSCSAFLPPDCEENDNASIRRFITGYVSRIAKATQGAVMMVHHEGKGVTGERQSLDRARGAGAFTDCPDVVLQMSAIYPPGGGDVNETLRKSITSASENAKALRLECVAIRDNAPFKPIDLIFDHPRFIVDGIGTLKNWQVMTSAQLGGKAAGAIQQQKALSRAETCLMELTKAQNMGGWKEISAADAAAEVSKRLGEQVTPQTLKRYIETDDKHGVFCINQTSPRRWHITTKRK